MASSSAQTPGDLQHPLQEASTHSRMATEPSSSSSQPRAQQASLHQTARPHRKRTRLPGGVVDFPKSILKPSPPPQKSFSFRRDILQNLNTRLAQQGVNVQVPLPQAGTAQGAANLLGGMFKKIGGMAAGAAGAALSSTFSDSSAGQMTIQAQLFSHPGERAASQPPLGSAAGASDPPLSPAAASLQNVAARLQAAGQATAANSSIPSSPAAFPTETPTSLALIRALPPPSSSVTPLKRVQFTVSKMAVVYPISSEIPIEDEDDTRKRIEALHRQALRERKEKSWTPQELEALYRDCCRVREEHPLKKMRLVFEEAAKANPPALKTLDLSFLPLDRQAIDPLADLLSVDFGLSKLILENCGLTDDGAKAILHALLVSGTLSNLSLASNRKLKYNGWRYVAIFMRRAKALRYLDLSENSINRASLEHIVDAIRKPPEAIVRDREELAQKGLVPERVDIASTAEDYDEDGEPLMPPAPLLRRVSDGDASFLTTAIVSLRLENCGLKGASLAMLAQGVRFSQIKHLSLRRNRINPMGAVALAVMLKDYPDSPSEPQRGRVGSEPTEPEAGRSGRHIGPGLGYSSALQDLSPDLPEIPLITPTLTGGVTARHVSVSSQMSRELNGAHSSEHARHQNSGCESQAGGHDMDVGAVALSQAKRAKRMLDNMPRMGSLLTVDLKSNDIRGGVTYLAQVLKKNRTLRVLNLSDNHVDVQGLVALAEALKYNSTLETLDVSHNPCAGPGLEGITTLRTAFALNSNLKRLFMNDTDLSSEGAIALAEFLPEAHSLIHLDLTENFEVDMAGVMALAVSLKMNKSLRCLDMNIPPNDPDFARLSQGILQSCIRNTQLAQRRAQQKGLRQPVAAPIYKSIVARAAQEKDERAKAMEKARKAEQNARATAAANRTQNQNKLIDAAEQCHIVLRDLLNGEKRRLSEAQSADKPATTATSVPTDFVEELVTQSKGLRQGLAEAVATMTDDGDRLAKALKLSDDLENITDQLIAFYKSNSAPSISVSPAVRGHAEKSGPEDEAHQSIALESVQVENGVESTISSSSFSLGSDDDDDEDEEGDSDGSQATRLSESMKSLGLQDSMAQVVAEKEPELESGDARLVAEGTSLSPGSEAKARSMVDEEGEIFKRAKSLQTKAEEEGEGEAQVGDGTTQHSGIVPISGDDNNRSESGVDYRPSDIAAAESDRPANNLYSAATETEQPDGSKGTVLAVLNRPLSSSLASASSVSSAASAMDTPPSGPDILGNEDASGEELRRQLLDAA